MKTTPSAPACPQLINSLGIFLAGFLGCILPIATAHAADIVWTNTAGGSWNAAANWSPNQVPLPGDIAYLTNNGTYTVTLNVTTNISGLFLGGTSGTQTLSHTTGTLTLNGPGASSANGVYSLAGGTLNGTSTLTLAGPFNWSSGTLGIAASTFVVNANGGLTLSGITKTFSGGTLVNNNTGTWTAGQINCNGNAVFSNAPGATFDLQGTGNSFVLNSSTPTLANAGTLRRTVGTGTAVIDLPCANSGSIQITTGLLSLTGGGTNTGQFVTSDAATLIFGGGTQLLQGGSSVSGPGNVSVSSGTVTVQGTFAIGALTNSGTLNFNSLASAYVTNLTLSAGTLTGSNTVVVPGPFNWTGGSLGSAGSPLFVAANGGLALGGSTKTFSGGTLVNNGTAAWTAGQINCNSTALFSNAPSATLDLQADGSAFVLNSGTPTLANAGTLRKTAGTGTSTIGLPCANSGSVQVNTGSLSLNGGGTSTGQFSNTTGTTLMLGSGTHLLQPGSSVSGPGNMSVSGTVNVQGTFVMGALTNSGTLNFNSLAIAYVTNLTLSAGILAGSNTVVVPGPLNWNGGSFGSAGSSLFVAANGGLALSGSLKTFLGGTLVNGGAAVWTAGQINCNSTAMFSNAPSATLDLQADGTSFLQNSGTPTLVNAGILRKTAGTGTSTITVPCANLNSVQVNSGTLALALSDSTGAFTTPSGSTLNVSGPATLSPAVSITGAGNFGATGGAITNLGLFAVTGTNSFTGGTFSQNGNCLVTGGALVINVGTAAFNGSGTIAPASLNLAAGILQGSMTVTVTGPTAWSGGSLGSAGSSLVVLANGGLTLSGSLKTFLGGTLVNGGAAVWTAGQINCNGSAFFSNAPSATLDLQADGTSFLQNSGSPAMANAGTLRKTAGTGTSTITVPCANLNSVQVNSGTLALTLENSSGSFTTALGTTLSVNGTALLSPAASISGAGNFGVTGGTITNNGSFTVAGTNTFSAGIFSQNGNSLLTGPLIVNVGSIHFNGTGTITPATVNLSAGILAGSQPVTIVGPFNWSGGSLGSAGSGQIVTANGGITLNGSTKSLFGGSLVNQAAAVWTAGQINCNGTVVFSNAPGATLDFQADGSALAASTGTPTLANAGTLRKTAGAGTSTLNLLCQNSGTIQVNSGTLGWGSVFVQSTGQTLLNGGNLSFPFTGQFRGGLLSGAGTITGSVSNNATVSPGASPGILTISGNYTEAPGAHMQIKLGGTTPGSGHDQLSVGGNAKLAGTLDVTYFGGFVPAPGNVFTSLVCNVRSGGFSAIIAPTNTIGTIYTAKTVLIETGNASPAAQLNVNPSQLACRSFVLQASATDPDGTITNLTLLFDTNVLISTTSAAGQTVFSYDFPGDVTFTVLATDNKGASGATNVIVNIGTLPLLTLDPIGFQTNRAFKLCMAGEAGTNYEVQANSNLTTTSWTVLGVMQNTNGIWRYTDATATNAAVRFYRSRQLP